MSNTPDLDRLKDPFPADDIEWRIGQSGKTRAGNPWAKVLAYLTNRAIMDRLDEVCGPAGWENRFERAPNDPKGESLLCGIGVRIGDCVVWKWDGAGNTEFEAVKGGISDSMKRAAVQWGIGRYLYGLGESWANCTEDDQKGQDGWRYAKTKDGSFWWKPPALPAWATQAPSNTAAKQGVIDASGGKVRQASDLQADGGGRDWFAPPAEVLAALDREQSHPWFCQALKGLLEEAGADTVGKVRAMLTWLTGLAVPNPQVIKGDAALSQVAWQKIKDAREELGVSLADMLAEALSVHPPPERKPKAESGNVATQKQLVDSGGYAG